MSADRPGPRREGFAAYHARCRRHLLLVQAHTHGPGQEHRLAWYGARLEATTLSDADLALAIAAMGPVRPSISAADIGAVRKHALMQELRRRQRLSSHERMGEAILHRRLAAEASRGEDDDTTSEAGRERPTAH